MNVAPPPRWVRRLVVAPLVVVLALLLVPTTLMLALVIGASITWLLPGRLRVVRVLWMASFYILWDALAVVALFGLWVASVFGLALSRPAFRRAHVRLARFMLGLLFWQVRWTLRLRIEVEADDPDRLRDEGPLLVVSRHAGPGDSFILVDVLLGLARREPAIVLKDTLQWDPAIDVLLNRLSSAFVTPRSRRRPGSPGGSAAVGALAAGLGPHGALVLFPEGGNVTPGRRARRIEALREAGHGDLAEQAVAMPHVMAPHVGGFLAALDAAPDAGVLVVAHTGLERLVTVRDIWRELPMDKHIVLGGWFTPARDLPAQGPARETWLFEQWVRVDAWIEERTPADVDEVGA